MTNRAGISGLLLVVVLAGCGAPPPPRAVTAAPPARPAPAPAPAPEEAPDVELTTTVTTHGDDLVAFLERATDGRTLPEPTRSELLARRPQRGDRVTGFRIRTGPWTCFVQRAQRDDRATVVRTSPEGFLVVPIAWISDLLALPGPSREDVVAFYGALGRQLAKTGRASGLARFDNGNATELSLRLHELGEDDVEVVAERRFLRAGEYDPNAARVSIVGVQQVQTRARNRHRGVSAHDLLRTLAPEPSAPAPLAI